MKKILLFSCFLLLIFSCTQELEKNAVDNTVFLPVGNSESSANIRSLVEDDAYSSSYIAVEESWVDRSRQEFPEHWVNLAEGKTALASSEYNAQGLNCKVEYAVDGNPDTFWASGYTSDSSTPEWMFVDLGEVRKLSAIRIRWTDPYYSVKYDIGLAGEDKQWQLYSLTSDGGDDYYEVPVECRYLGIMNRQKDNGAIAVSEIELFADESPVAINGQLYVDPVTNQLCNQYGNAIQLRGMSTHGTQWHEHNITPASMDVLAYDWDADIVRVSTYITEGGLSTNYTKFINLAKEKIDYAIERGLYVIIDWHMLDPGDPMDPVYMNLVDDFFKELAASYGHLPNIIYEICNEPSSKNTKPENETWQRIRDYAEIVIPYIRDIDSDAVILVGTRAWSSLGQHTTGGGWREIYNDIQAQGAVAENIMYVAHFYAAEHGTYYLDHLKSIVGNDGFLQIPLFVTEWSLQNAAGEGANDLHMGQQYAEFMEKHKISWVMWNYSDNWRSGGAFKDETITDWNDPNQVGNPDNLKEAGIWYRDHILLPADDFPVN